MKKLFTTLIIIMATACFYTASACLTVTQISMEQVGDTCKIQFAIGDTTGNPNGISCVRIRIFAQTFPFVIDDEMDFQVPQENRLPDTVTYNLTAFTCDQIVAIEAEGWTSQNCGHGAPCDLPLPVELASFRGEALSRANKLSWTTASEENTMAFVVERSGNGRTGWRELGRVDAVGFSAESQHYTFMDESPLFAAYYRLRNVDFDGYYDYSDIIFIERDRKLIDDVLIFPNPVQDDWVQVSFRTGTARNSALILLTDLNGHILMSNDQKIQEGLNTFDLNLADLPEGVYFLRIERPEGAISKKIVKVAKKE